MKHAGLLIGWILILTIMTGCQKQVGSVETKGTDPFITESVEYLKKTLQASELASLDLEHFQLLKGAESNLSVARFYVKGNSGRSVTIFKGKLGLSGTWLELQDLDVLSGKKLLRAKSLEGQDFSNIEINQSKAVKISAGNKDRRQELTIRYQDGVQSITSLADASAKRDEQDEESYQWLPEFSITAIRGSGATTFFSLFWLTNMNSDYLYAYTSIDPYGPEQGGGNNGSPGDLRETDDLILAIPYEFPTDPAINLSKYLKCFENIPSAGAKYSITLYADIPVNSNPMALANFLSPGHCFVSMTKSNGSNSVTQVFGFYPAVGTLSVLSTAVKGKMRDNSEHDYDASITLDHVDPYSFNTAASLAQYYSSGMLYDLNYFNCTDYAIDVFNKARPLDEQLTVPDWTSEVSKSNYGTTPNGLYNLLSSSKHSNSAGAENITLGSRTAPRSKGECN